MGAAGTPSLGIKDSEGKFHSAPEDLDFSPLVELFRRGVLEILREKKRLSERYYRKLLGWRHSGFSVDASVRSSPGDRQGLERLCCYLLKPPISLQRLLYVKGSPTVVYKGKYNPGTGSNFNTLDAKEFLVLLLIHTPAPYEARIRYFGAASSTARRGQGKAEQPSDVEEDTFKKPRRASWARLIHKIYGVDPLTCPSCGGRMRVLSIIQDEDTIERILRHLKLWCPKRGPPREAPAEPDGDGYRIEYDEAFREVSWETWET